MNEQALAELAQGAAISRLLHYADAPGCEVRRGEGWVAVRTGVESNDMNGVVSDVGVVISPPTVAALIGWFGARTPASWLVARADSQLTDILVQAGARPDRLGRWSGGPMPSPMPSLTPSRMPSPTPSRMPSRMVGPIRQGTSDVTVLRVTKAGQLDTWMDLAAACGWVDNPRDRQARRRLYFAMGLDGARPLKHWLGLVDDEPVGFASSYLAGETVDLCNLGVLSAWRRRGVGRALVLARLRDAARSGTTNVVSAPSQDGWELQRSLGFRNVPVIEDTWFYLPRAT